MTSEPKDGRMNAESLVGKATGLEEYFRHELAQNVLGGPARLRVIVLLACVLGLDAADKATIGAIAVQLEAALHINNTEIGLLVTASTAIGALATLPVGILADRVRRVDMLTAAIAIWSIAMVASGFSDSYLMLLLTRLALGAVVATATPAIASLMGDFFSPRVRGRIYGYVLTGELIGAGIGFMIVGNIAALLSWRAAFWTLAALGFALAFAIWSWLPEPARGGQSRIEAGDKKITRAEDADEHDANGGGREDPAGEGQVGEDVVERGIRPRSALVLHGHPEHMSAWQAFGYVLRVPTLRTLILASSLGYFYFTGLRTFAVVFLRGRFGLAQTTATMLLVAIGVGAVVGALITGRLSDRLIDRGHLTARIMVSGAAFLAAVALFLPGIFIPTLLIAAPLFFIAAAALGGTNPPLDAARLDIMHFRLWGRAESARMALRLAFEAIAPLLFGYVSTLFGGGGGLGRANPKSVQPGAVWLDYTFVIMLVPLLAAGLITLWAQRTYPRDVATAIASARTVGSGDTRA
jgi:predicted MFS family arabinose efflux permease